MRRIEFMSNTASELEHDFKNEITAKSRRKRRYSDTEGNKRTDGSPDGKYLASTRPGVGHNIRKAEPSPRNDLYPSSERASIGVTARKEGATGKLRKKRYSDVNGADDVFESQLRRQNLSALILVTRFKNSYN